MSKSRKRSTKSGRKLAVALREAYKNARADGAKRRRIMENFIGWAYANGHDIPETREEIDAMVCVFELFLRESTTEGWHDDYRRMNRARMNRHPPACRWWTVCRTLSRELPGANTGRTARREALRKTRRETHQPHHFGVDLMYRSPYGT